MADGLWQVGLWQQGRAGGLAMIGIGHPREIARPTHGYAETREAAMAAFAKSCLAARSRNAGNKAVKRVARRHDDRNCGGCFLGRPQPLIAPDQHHVHIETGKLAGQFREAIEIPSAHLVSMMMFFSST